LGRQPLFFFRLAYNYFPIAELFDRKIDLVSLSFMAFPFLLVEGPFLFRLDVIWILLIASEPSFLDEQVVDAPFSLLFLPLPSPLLENLRLNALFPFFLEKKKELRTAFPPKRLSLCLVRKMRPSPFPVH